MWKAANVTPIFKKGSKADPGNYRPVSLTSVCCKLFESILRDALMNHLISNNLLSNSQHGFKIMQYEPSGVPGENHQSD
jgi:hypothetical protein